MRLTDDEYGMLLGRTTPELREDWERFVAMSTMRDVMSPEAWRRLYVLSVRAYALPREQRWRTSEFALMCKRAGVLRPGDAAIAYTHAVLTLAVADNVTVFGDGFLV